MKTLLVILFVCCTITSTKAAYEWTEWSLCSLGCGAGERSRICRESAAAGVTTCREKATQVERCKKERCNTSGGSTLPGTLPPIKLTPAPEVRKLNTIQNCDCGCKLTQERGRVQTKFRKFSFCSWEFIAKKDYQIRLTFNKLENFDWNNGGLYIGGPSTFVQFKKTDGKVFVDSLPVSYKSKNTMNITLHNSRLKYSRKDVELEFQFITYPDYTKAIIPDENDDKEKIDEASKKGGNAILVGSIGTCVAIILVAVAVIIYRKKRNRGEHKNGDVHDEGVEDTCSSIAGSARSARQNKLTSPRKDRNIAQNKILTPKATIPMLNPRESERLINNGKTHVYPDTHDIFIQGQEPTMVATFIHNGQPYINWPMHPPAAMMAQHAHLNHPKQMSFETINSPQNNMQVYYPASGTEG